MNRTDLSSSFSGEGNRFPPLGKGVPLKIKLISAIFPVACLLVLLFSIYSYAGPSDPETSFEEELDPEEREEQMSAGRTVPEKLTKDPLSLATKDIRESLTDSTKNSAIKSFAASVYSVSKKAAAAAFSLSVISGILLLAVYGPKIKSAVAESLLTKAVIFILITGFVSLADLILPLFFDF